MFLVITQDEEVALAVSKYKAGGWLTVVDHLSFHASVEQCQSRWSHYIEPLQQGLRSDANWTEKEVIHSRCFVTRNTYLTQPFNA